MRLSYVLVLPLLFGFGLESKAEQPTDCLLQLRSALADVNFRIKNPDYVINIKKKSWNEKWNLFKALLNQHAIVSLEIEDKTFLGKPRWHWVTGALEKVEIEFGRRSVKLQGIYGGHSLNSITRVQVRGVAGKGPGQLAFKYGYMLLPTNIETEKRLSGINRKTWDFIEREGATVVTLEEFLLTGQPGGTLLGLDGDIYNLIAKFFGLEKFEETYNRMNLDWEEVDDHTHVFMSEVYGSPFLVPRNLFQYDTDAGIDGSNITRDEFLWLLAHRNQLSSTTFVLGAEDSLLIGENTTTSLITPFKRFVESQRRNNPK
jgi:hypothetical protein